VRNHPGTMAHITGLFACHRTDLTPEFFYRLTQITGSASPVPIA
jgi:hypothetical protein